MTKNMFRSLTDLLPVAGGATGAATAAERLPSVQSIIVFIVMTIVGAIIGYLVKLGLDCIFKHKDKKHE
jgi:hypothetical protein